MMIGVRTSIAVSALFTATGGAAWAESGARPAGDFCARLAHDSGIDHAPSPDGRTEWTAKALNLGQRVLLGGSAATGVGVDPVEPSTVEDYRRLSNMCTVKDKGAQCLLVGPVIFKFSWRGRQVLTPMAAGERATIDVLGLKTRCRTEPSA